jgi:DNA-binding transcriptional regulator YiaG
LAGQENILIKDLGFAGARAMKKQRSVGAELVRRLKKFTDALEATEDLKQRFTCRTVRLTVQTRRFTPENVRETRRALRASQAIFAQFLGVSLSAVRDWEQGLKKPGGAACRLMDEIRRNPDYFLLRLKDFSTPLQAG